MEISKEKLEAFFEWLKKDGLPPKRSERLWRKTITAKLLHDDPITLSNYEDFLIDYNQKLETQKSNMVPFIDHKIMIGISLKRNNVLKVVHDAIDADSYIHLFFDDGSDELVHKKVCIQIISPL